MKKSKLYFHSHALLQSEFKFNWELGCISLIGYTEVVVFFFIGNDKIKNLGWHSLPVGIHKLECHVDFLCCVEWEFHDHTHVLTTHVHLRRNTMLSAVLHIIGPAKVMQTLLHSTINQEPRFHFGRFPIFSLRKFQLEIRILSCRVIEHVLLISYNLSLIHAWVEPQNCRCESSLSDLVDTCCTVSPWRLWNCLSEMFRNPA